MNNKIMSKVFGWMFIGLMISFATGYVVSLNPTMIENVFGGAWWILLIAELGIVIFLSARIAKMSPTTAKVSFLLYSFVSGLTFSSIFIVYEMSSIIFVFLITGLIFGIFALIGYTTNIDLMKLRTYLFMGLLAIIICSIVNLFIGSSGFNTVLSLLTVVIFIGYTAYDVQKVRRLYEENALPEDNLAIYGALELYLDFINLFIHLLDLLGKDN
ncbi:MAG: Bax inhibitor-1/YccA family protein [Bacilli bacterium]|nr:Bax inhibitor-1/YccA family protein [Bacilli bacterium]MBR1817847.1 Bax inhibitor-1/YccA family protein [Bacilli bacterium]